MEGVLYRKLVDQRYSNGVKSAGRWQKCFALLKPNTMTLHVLNISDSPTVKRLAVPFLLHLFTFMHVTLKSRLNLIQPLLNKSKQYRVSKEVSGLSSVAVTCFGDRKMLYYVEMRQLISTPSSQFNVNSIN